MKDIFLVDADDTILDFHASSDLAVRHAFSLTGRAWDESYLAKFHEVNDSLWEALQRKEIVRAELLRTRFPLYLQTLGITGVDGEAFNRAYLKFLSENPVYIQGAEAFLQKLNALGRVYIVTNGTAWIQKSRFERAGLYAYAQDTFVSDTIGADKPAKAYTDFVVAHIPDFDRERAVWIGDSLSADIRAANEAGITSVWFNPKGKKRTAGAVPDYEIHTFEEAIALFTVKKP